MSDPVHAPDRPIIAARWAAFSCAAAASTLPGDVEERARLCLADHLHAAMHGARSDTGQLLRAYVGDDRRAEAFALYAGAISAVHEIDDVHQDTSLHPGSVVVPAVLAAAAECDASGARALAAIAAGYEIAIRLSVAAGHRHYHYFHATATCGAIAAAAAAAIVYGLDEAQTAHAIGVAATSASGLWEGINDEAVPVKHLHPGLAAERGVRAAKLARLGLRAASRSIEGDKGFLAALAQSGPHAPSESPTRDETERVLVEGLGARWAILRNIYKRYPFCLGCFEPLEGIRDLVSSRVRDVNAIASLRVVASPSVAWMVGQREPSDEFEAKFSAAHALALVLAGYDPERVPMQSELLSDPDVLRWRERVEVEADPAFGRRRARVIATLDDASVVSVEAPFRNLDADAVRERFGRACRLYLGERGAALERLVDGGATLGRAAELMPLVRAALPMMR